MDAKSNSKKYNHKVDTDFDIEINMYTSSREQLKKEYSRIKNLKIKDYSQESLREWMLTLLIKHINTKTLFIIINNGGKLPKKDKI